jgi:hypothetical protein
MLGGRARSGGRGDHRTGAPPLALPAARLPCAMLGPALRDKHASGFRFRVKPPTAGGPAISWPGRAATRSPTFRAHTSRSGSTTRTPSPRTSPERRMVYGAVCHVRPCSAEQACLPSVPARSAERNQTRTPPSPAKDHPSSSPTSRFFDNPPRQQREASDKLATNRPT